MKDFDNSLLVQMAAEQALFFWLVNMEISDSLNQYYTTLDIDVFCDSNLYQSAEFEVRPVNYSMDMAVDKLQLDFANVDLTMSATPLNNTVTNRPVIVLLGTLVDSVPVVEEVFRGVVSAWELDEKKQKSWWLMNWFTGQKKHCAFPALFAPGYLRAQNADTQDSQRNAIKHTPGAMF